MKKTLRLSLSLSQLQALYFRPLTPLLSLLSLYRCFWSVCAVLRATRMEEKKMYQAAAFGSWHHSEPVIQAGFAGTSFFCEEDLFKVPVAIPLNSAYLNGGHYRAKVRKRNGVGVEKQSSCREQMQRRQKNPCDFAAGAPRRSRAPKAVDEDLYKIPHGVHHQKPQGKRLPRSLLSGCLCLSCIR